MLNTNVTTKTIFWIILNTSSEIMPWNIVCKVLENKIFASKLNLLLALFSDVIILEHWRLRLK